MRQKVTFCLKNEFKDRLRFEPQIERFVSNDSYLGAVSLFDQIHTSKQSEKSGQSFELLFQILFHQRLAKCGVPIFCNDYNARIA
jgi:hypothetical protein